MQVLDLFSGIGGFALGLESVGMKTVAFCESDGYARRILKRHWPEVWLYDDVQTLTSKRLNADGVGPVDLVCGGFPCQDVSSCNSRNGLGIDGPKSGLWREFARLVGEVRPRWVVAENSPHLRTKGIDQVLRDLEGLGYAARPIVVGAVHAGADHRCQRVWIVANADRDGRIKVDPARVSDVRDRKHRQRDPLPRLGGGRMAPPRILRTSDGVPSRAHRIRCLGNAVVPQVVAMIGRSILSADQEFYGPSPVASPTVRNRKIISPLTHAPARA